MSRINRWVVLNADGSINCQPIVPGEATPSEAGDNPNGLREYPVPRHGDLRYEHFDIKRRRWVTDKAKKQSVERQASRAGMSRDELAEHIADEVEARLGERITAIEARIASLEAAGAKK